MTTRWVIASALGVVAAMAIASWRPWETPTVVGRDRGSVSILEALRAGDRRGFRRIVRPEDLVFPRDHGPHRDVQLEWWYVTGNVASPDGRPFGFELTFFRTGLVASPAARASAWACSETYMAHFAITDPVAGTFRASERFARGALGLGFAQAEPFAVGAEDWSVSALDAASFPGRMTASEEDRGLDIVLTPAKPPVLHGDRGYSRKGADPGNASLYVASTRLEAQGALTSNGVTYSVTGLAWMDHEWSTSVLDEDIVGWDWFSLQLTDGRDVMVYALRRQDGTAGPYSHGSIVDREGRSVPLEFSALRLETLARWTSPMSRVRYPARWSLELPGEPEPLILTPLLADQELRLAVTYYEGAVSVTSVAGAVRGRGYVELVGYGPAR